MIPKPYGCDVGSGKGGHLFDGVTKVEKLTPQGLVEAFAALRSKPEVLVAWDSPLTGPLDPDGVLRRKQDLTQRLIESFFRSKNPPDGISVQGYCGCSHWTLSQRVLGLPRVGPYSTSYDGLPFRLVCDREQLATSDDTRASVVEVHPAVAIWMWYQAAKMKTTRLRYKNLDAKSGKRRVKAHWKVIRDHVYGATELPDPEGDDDRLDCLVGWLLARNWIAGNDVILLGNKQTGSFLVPNVRGIAEEFEQFLKNPRVGMPSTAASSLS
ncbi:MAG: DUF429 domain-containing protein [Gemmataceae bacterium]